MFILNFFLGALIVFGGIMILKYNYQVVNVFGRNNVFERRLGAGSSYPMFKLIGVLIIVGGLLTMASLHDNVLWFLLSPITNALGIKR